MNLTVTPYNLSAKTPMQTKKNNVSFAAHPDFYALKKNYEVTASSYFRRGQFYGSPSKSFIDIVSTLSNLLYKPFTDPKKILIAGIGDSQEVFSYLAVIKNLMKQQDISKVVDLYTVDLQSKPSAKKIMKDAFYDGVSRQSMYASESFVRDLTPNGQHYYQEYRVKDDVIDLVQKAYKDKEKSKWNTRVQDAVKTYSDNYFDLISCNNTLGYIRNEEQINQTVKDMFRSLKPNGFLILDPDHKYITTAKLYDKVDYVFNGIYRKL